LEPIVSVYASQAFVAGIERAARAVGRPAPEVVRDLLSAHHLRMAQDGGAVAPMDGVVVVHGNRSRPMVCSLELSDGRIFLCAFLEWTPDLIGRIMTGTDGFAVYPLARDD